jgi:mono/diheme cytochrome c family protein
MSSRPASRRVRALRLPALALAALVLGACDWFTNFEHQTRLEPWEQIAGDTVPFRGNPEMSVPTHGALVPAYRVSYNALPATIDSMSALPNPVAADSASLDRGYKYYAINCAVCHGYDGAGNKDTLIAKYGLAVSLQTPSAQGRSDGYIFGMIRNGRGLMPSYDRIEEMHRWDVVNYLKGLQGRLGRPVAQGPVGVPGEGWPKVPGATRIAPTRPAPHAPVAGEIGASLAPGGAIPGVPPARGADTTTTRGVTP